MTTDPLTRPEDRSAATDTSVPPSTFTSTAGRVTRGTVAVSGNASQGPLPLVLGVTGHRDLRPEDIPALEAQVQAIFDEFKTTYPHTPLTVVSPLAEGADRLVARVARRNDAQIVCPLPLPRAEYEKDFATTESRVEFTELLNSAISIVEMPLLPGTHERNIDDPKRRADQYALVGAYVVRQCQVLIALWNGLPATVGGGGTGEIVGFMYHGLPERFESLLTESHVLATGLLDVVETGPVYHILTPRQSASLLERRKPLTLERCFPGDGGGDHIAENGKETKDEVSEEETSSGGRAQALFQHILSDIDGFNEEAVAANADPMQQGLFARNAGYLMPDSEADDLPALLRHIRTHYAIADTLAQQYQHKTFRTLRILCFIVFLALMCFELTSKLAAEVAGVEMFFPALLLVAYAVWNNTVRKGRWQDRYQDYRALAEGLRVEFFWRLSGLPTSVSDHYLRRQRGELEWIRIAVRNLGSESLVPPNLHPGAALHSSKRFDLVMKHWVADQAKYFHRAVERDEKELERLEKQVQYLIASGPILAGLTGIVGLVPSPLSHLIHEIPIIHKILIILVFASAGVGGIIHTYLDRRALSQQVKQYERMASLFSIAKKQLEERVAAGEFVEAHRLLLDLGRETLAENGDWVLMHRERPVDVPHAG